MFNKTCGKVDDDISGAPIKIIHDIDKWEHCAYLCYQDNKCQFWTWTSSRFPLDSFVGDCDLKERDEGRKKVIGIISGTSDCGRNLAVLRHFLAVFVQIMLLEILRLLHSWIIFVTFLDYFCFKEHLLPNQLVLQQLHLLPQRFSQHRHKNARKVLS